ncbi:MAG: hypothetical protein HYV24_04645 [Deltaproteobacteria bacterium]|nr:hypothetical protein [Deltaproteobacteria bacterium]
MRKLILLCAVFLILICSCTYIPTIPTHNFMIGERYAVIIPEKVHLLKRPSANAEPFEVERPEEFVIEGVECTIRTEKGDCPLDAKTSKDVFYRIRFEGGEEAFLRTFYIFGRGTSGYLLPLGPRREQNWKGEDTFEVRAGFDEMWDIAVRAVHDLGYTITQMRKEDGYLSTDTREEGNSRSRLAVWLSMDRFYARVEVDATSEYRSRTKDRTTGQEQVSPWYEGGKSYYQYQFMDRIRQRLWASYKEAKK